MATSNKTLSQILEKHMSKHLDCFGAFDSSNPVCRKHCAICLKCVIEKNRNFQLDLIDDFLIGESPAPVGLN